MNRFHSISLIFAISFAALACSQKPVTTPELTGPNPSEQRRLLPITLIEQELPLSVSKAWEIVTVALQQQDIPLAEVIENEHIIVSEWLPMRDRLCSTATSGSVPLNCQTQYRLAIYPGRAQQSLMRIRYTEDCRGETQLFLTCPNSTAETRMIEIVGDIKALAGIQ